MRGLLRIITLLAWLLPPAMAEAYYLDTPHNESNGIVCSTCHDSAPYYVTDWPDRTAANPDDTMSNAICLECHAEASTNPLKGPGKKLHASSTIPGATTWSTECIQCHDAHAQGQLDWSSNDVDPEKLFLVSGSFETIPANGGTALVYNAAGNYTTIGISVNITGAPQWTDTATWNAKGGQIDPVRAVDGSRGLVLVPNKSNPNETFEIIEVTPTAVNGIPGYLLKIKGRIASGIIPGQIFGVIYGQALKSQLMPNGGSSAADYRDVKFFLPGVDPASYGGFVDVSGGTRPVGSCQVCHTSTGPWGEDGSGADHYPDSDCKSCHNILAGGGAPLVADSGGPYLIDQGDGVTLEGGASFETPCVDGVSNHWDLDNNGTYDAIGPGALGGRVDLTWAELATYGLQTVGAHPINLQVRNACDGAHAEASTTLTVYDNSPLAGFTATPNPAACGQTISFDAGASSHGRPDRSIVDYAWDFGDGTSASGATAGHAYGGFGGYSATLTVTDDNVPAKTDTETVLVNVSQGNQAPVANGGGPYSADLGDGISLNGSASSDPDSACGDSLVSYAWSIAGGAYTLSGSSPLLTADQISALGAGDHAVQLTVTDTFGATGIAASTLTIYNNSPVAGFTATPNPAACGQTISFDAGASSHGRPDRAIVDYAWDFGDGTSASGATAGHAYGGFGGYSATLTVTDNNLPARTDTETVLVNVSQGNQAPVANGGGPYSADLGDGISLNGSASTEPDSACGDSLVSYAWSIAGGAYTLSGSSPLLTADQINALGAGDHAVQLTVTDTFGATGIAASTLTIYNNSPVAGFTATPNPAACGQLISFDAGGSSHGRPDRAIVTYAWDFGDGTTASGATAGHAYGGFGGYSATLTVTDDNVPARTDSETIVVNVNLGNQAPVANGGGPYSLARGAGVILTGAASSDPDLACGDSLTYAWDLDNNGSDDLLGPTVALTWAELGAYGLQTIGVSNPIRLRVTDIFGATHTATTSLTVANQAPLAAAGLDQEVITGELVTLNGDGSSDGDNDPLTYSWSLTSTPVGSGAALVGATTATPTFTADIAGSYEVRLVVNDGTADSGADLVLVTALASLPRPLPDTGQTASTTATFGEDHDYLINPPAYTVHGDGTVTDNVTGLMWQQEDDGTLRDWGSASAYCANLELAGYLDWRLPSRKELLGIVIYDGSSPAIDATAFPNTKSGESADYWSASSCVYSANVAWGVNFCNGNDVDYNDKGSTLYVRCLRGAQ